MNFKKIVVSIIAVSTLLISASPALAHVVVKPKEVGVAAFQTFTVGVPVEKDVPTTEVRLVIPDGLNYVTPNVKPGWSIEVTKEGEGEEAVAKEIKWTGGSIPAGQRDEFLFSAQVPAEEATIAWKAYQTYAGGEVVSWDADPKAVEEHEKKNPDSHDDAHAPKPYSMTNVINDLKASATTESKESAMVAGASSNNLPMILSVLAIALSSAALFLKLRKKK